MSSIHVTREHFTEIVSHWRSLGVGDVDVRECAPACVGERGQFIATLRRSCTPEEAVHCAGWVEVQSLLADGSHYSRNAWKGTVAFTLYISRAADGLDEAKPFTDEVQS